MGPVSLLHTGLYVATMSKTRSRLVCQGVDLEPAIATWSGVAPIPPRSHSTGAWTPGQLERFATDQKDYLEELIDEREDGEDGNPE